MTSPRPMTIGTLSPFVPRAWLSAHGVRPRRLASRLGDCREQGAGHCRLAQAFVEQAGQPGLDGVIFDTHCDMMRRGADRFMEASARPAFLLNVPATWQTPESFAMYLAELRRLGAWLEGLGACAPDGAGLRWQARRIENHYARAVLAYNKTRADRAVSEPDGFGARVALIAAEPTQELRALRRWITARGGRVVLDATGRGPRAWPAPIDWPAFARDPLCALARAHFDALPDAFRRPDERLFAWLGERLRASGARGVVLAAPTWCDLWRVQAARFRDALGLPLVEVITDGARVPDASAATRIAALIEMLR